MLKSLPLGRGMFAAALFAASVCGQSLSTTFAAGNSLNAPGSNHFDVTVLNSAGVLITNLDVNCENTRNGPVGSTFDVEVYITAVGGTFAGNETNPAPWMLAGTGQGTSMPTGTPTPVDITDFPLAPGRYGFTVFYTFSGGSPGTAFAYTNGVMQFVNADLQIDTGSSSGNGLFTGSVFNPRSWNGTIYYSPAMNAALATPYGTGCGGDPNFPTYYELFDAANPNDLGGGTGAGITMNWTGSTYVVTQGASAIVAPTGAATPFTDDQTQQITIPFSMPTQNGNITDLYVCSNGFVALEPTTNADFSESVAELLSGEMRVCPYWDDFNPAAGGTINAEVDGSNPNLFHVTWTGVPEFGTSNTNDFQMSVASNGNIELKWGVMASIDGIVGYSPGNGAADPGGSDISAITVLPLGTGRPDLALASIARPVLGTTAMTETQNIPAGSPAGFIVYGFQQFNPGISLAGIGAPGCTQWISLDSASLFVPGGPTQTHSLGIPNVAAFAGANLYVQSAAVDLPSNMRGIITSNGMAWTLDIN